MTQAPHPFTPGNLPPPPPPVAPPPERPDREVLADLSRLPGLPVDPDVSYHPTLSGIRQESPRKADTGPAEHLPPPPPDQAPPNAAGQELGFGPNAPTGAIPLSPFTETISSVPNYRFGKVLGTGGFGEVLQAEQETLRRVVAVKRLRDAILRPGENLETMANAYRQAFRIEALLTANLEHPNIVPIHELVGDGDRGFMIAMKILRGKLWVKMLREDFKTLSPEEHLRKHLRILIDVAQAVAFAHSRGVVHRDLKPSQVMVGEFGEVQLMDWGLAVVVDERVARHRMPQLMREEGMPTLKTAQNPAGTPAYMAPEQTLATTEGISYQTDVFLLGAILYEILAGTPPYGGKKSLDAMLHAQQARWQAPRDRAQNRIIPPELEALARWAMSRDQIQRPNNVKIFLDTLRDHYDNFGRRWESRRLTEAVERASHLPNPSVQDLTARAAMLTRAEGLWGQNPEVDRLRATVLAAYAAASSLHQPDIMQGIMEAGHLKDRHLRNYLISYMERAYAEEQRRRNLWIQLALTGLAMLALLAIGVLLG